MAAPVPPINPAAVANLVKLVIGGTAAAWGVSNSLFNVEGGHRAIVFNRLIGIKETVGRRGACGTRVAKRIAAALRCRRCAEARRVLRAAHTQCGPALGTCPRLCVPPAHTWPQLHVRWLPSCLCYGGQVCLLPAAAAGSAVTLHDKPCPLALPCAWQTYQEGTHLMVPWFDRPIIYDVRARPSLISSTSGSRDLQMVRLQLVVTLPCLLHIHED